MTADAPGPIIRRKALELGFERVGFCEAIVPAEEVRHFDDWLGAGMHAEMRWMRTSAARRRDPRRVLPGVQSIIVVALAYSTPDSASTPDHGGDREARGQVARYALGDDYHDVMGDRLAKLERFIEDRAPGHRAMAYVDHGPVLERMWAARAGIGWVGKNSLILNKEMGSFFFLGVVLTTLPLPAVAPATDQCGSCALCIEACPTAAIVSPRVVDSRRCISYHTIELRGALPLEHREAIGTRLFGCDDCQDACPWNSQPRGGHPAVDRAFAPRKGSASPSLLELLTMTHAEYVKRFRGSAIKRATYQGMRRNAAACAGNVAGPREESAGEIAAVLKRLADDASDDPVVREQAGWSLSRIRQSMKG